MSNNQQVKRETMYERIKRMDEEELRRFIYLVYLAGNNDGLENLCDDPECSYFGDGFLHIKANDLMPNDNVDDLVNSWHLDE